MIAFAKQTITAIQTIEGITEYRLENGLQLLLIPDSSKPSTTVNMTYRVGSRHEQYGQTGMAHLLEHLVFRGSKNYPNALELFSQKGLSANGSTNTDRTNYYASFATNNETLSWYLHWQADTMQHLQINEENLKKEVDIVLNERERSQNNPIQVLFQRIRAAAYHWNNQGVPTIGAPDNLTTMSVEALQAFYHTYYQPNNATLTISGYFDIQPTLALVVDIFSSIPKPPSIQPNYITAEPIQDGERNIILRKTGGMPAIGSAYHIPPSSHSDYAPLDMAINMLSDRPSGHLYRHLVQDKQLVSNTFGVSSTQFSTGLAIFGAQLSDSSLIDESQQTLNHILENLANEPFTQEELNRSKTYWLNQWNKLFANTEQLGISISEAIAAGDWRLLFLERDRIKETTLEQVQQAAEKYFVACNRTSGQYIPAEPIKRAPKIELPDFNDMFANYKGDSTHQLIDAFDTSAEHIQEKTLKGTLALDNGTIHYALLPKPTRGNRVFAKYRIKFSALDRLHNQATLSGLAATMITMGAKNFNQQQIQDQIDAFNGSLSYHISANQLVASLTTTSDYLDQLLDFSFYLIQEATYPENKLNEFKKQVTQTLQASSSEPGAKAAHTLNRYLSHYEKDDFRYAMTFEEQIAAVAAISSEQLLSFRQTNFGAGDIDIAIVGSFEAKQTLKTIKDTLSKWPKAPTYHYMPDPYDKFPRKEFIIKTPDKENAVFIGKLYLPIQNTHPHFPALVMANHLIGGNETSRLFKAVRADKGLSYSINSSINASSFEPSAEWTIQAIYSPNNRDTLKQVLTDTFEQLYRDGFSVEEVTQGIESIINIRSLARTQDSVVSSTWLRYLESGRDFHWNAKFEQSIKALSVEDVNAAFRDYLNFNEMSTAYAGDFA
ncbi:zinc protease [Pelistega indica]|uniref:Zinc protease n=1 Tax=Pelistega indica TaxID=1414851 RepID=V8G4X3_9BURK|nr:M16 family metallopeptidase [Pelistega indica]ETD71156.1 zinc protease [Pelistega indica]